MAYPLDCKYTKDHEWVRVEGDSLLIGITDFAQQELGEIVYVELPTVGRSYSKGETLCVVESTKAASDVYAPVSGTVKEVNSKVAADSTLLNSSPHTEGWLLRLENFRAAELEELLDSEAYLAQVGA